MEEKKQALHSRGGAQGGARGGHSRRGQGDSGAAPAAGAGAR